ncbi:MAG: DUF3343 domain-containing protein [Oscillospiraceae bacterium]|nr:DUF3343 domain-containing protein [Oscillospiraceae bacterium]MDD4367640.1 DUF3343 domain-containing protein [Oscillospiraceae bacterium]
MYQPTVHLIIAFGQTTAALKMETCCQHEGLPGRLIPLPQQIRAGCGLVWAAAPEAENSLTEMMERQQIAVQGIYTLYF